jgi:hypothetical protein
LIFVLIWAVNTIYYFKKQTKQYTNAMRAGGCNRLNALKGGMSASSCTDPFLRGRFARFEHDGKSFVLVGATAQPLLLND